MSPNSPLRALAHVCIRARNLAASEAFYVGLLGLERQFRFMRKGVVIGLYLRLTDRVFVEIFTADAAPETTTAHRLGHVCFETEDLATLHARLVAAGHAPGPIKLGADRTLQFWTKDPDGVPLEFQQYTPESAQFRHADVEVDW